MKIANFLPLTYVIKLLHGLWGGESWGLHGMDALVLAGMLVVGCLAPVKTFRLG